MVLNEKTALSLFPLFSNVLIQLIGVIRNGSGEVDLESLQLRSAEDIIKEADAACGKITEG